MTTLTSAFESNETEASRPSYFVWYGMSSPDCDTTESFSSHVLHWVKSLVFVPSSPLGQEPRFCPIFSIGPRASFWLRSQIWCLHSCRQSTRGAVTFYNCHPSSLSNLTASRYWRVSANNHSPQIASQWHRFMQRQRRRSLSNSNEVTRVYLCGMEYSLRWAWGETKHLCVLTTLSLRPQCSQTPSRA